MDTLKLKLSLLALLAASTGRADEIRLPQPAAADLASRLLAADPYERIKDATLQYWLADVAAGGLERWSPWGAIPNGLYALWQWRWTVNLSNFYVATRDPNIEYFTISVSYSFFYSYRYFPDYTLLKETTSPDIYVMIGRVPLYVRSGSYFGWNWGAVKTVAPGRITSMRRIPVDGTVLKEESKPEVYVMFFGTKRHIMTEATLFRLGKSWFDMRVVPDGSLNHIPRGSDIW